MTYPPFAFNQFIRDRVTDTTVLASVSPSGTAAAERNASLGRITASGAVVFASSAGNLTSPPQGLLTNLYVFRMSGALSISGVVTAGTGGPLAGVTLTLSGTQGGSTTSDASGAYAFGNLPLNGSFTVTPSRAGFSFAPPDRSFTAVASSITGADFVGTAPAAPATYTISGRVQDRLGTGVEGVLVSLTGTQAAAQPTDAEGQFAFSGLAAGGNYTVTPTKTGFVFDPVTQSFSNLQSNQTTVFFTATVGVFTRYFAEGATSAFFDTAVALLNASGTPTVAHVSFQRSDGLVRTVDVPLAGIARATVDPKTLPEFVAAEMATVVTSDQPVIADRTMRWDASGYGSHAETSIAAPQSVWYLAEGATIAGFNLFYLLQNPGTTAADVTVRYLLPSPAPPVVKQYTIDPQTRFNIWVNQEDARLDDAEVSAVITVTTGVPIIVERAMYLDAQGRTFGAGHESAGVPAPMTSWFLAEGATGSYFDLFVLVANPADTAAELEVRYLLPTGDVIAKPYTVPGNSRFNIWVDLEDARLADTPVSTSIVSSNGVPVIVERAMWWPGTTETWQEGHNSAGAIQTGTKWGLAEGELGGDSALETYVLVANTSSANAQVRVTLYFEGGATAERVYSLAANSRLNIPILTEFPEAGGKRFGAIVESLGSPPAPIVVERSRYSNSQGTDWAAGTNNIATRLR